MKLSTQAMRPYPFADLGLGRRLERTEGLANAAFIEARADCEPSSDAAWTSVAGVYAMFDGVGSPLTQTFGLGVFDPVREAELEELEAFFMSRGAPVFHEVSPFISADVLELLTGRGYKPVEFSTVLVRPTEVDSGVADPGVTVRQTAPDERDLWSKLAGEGWRSESAELAAFIEAFGQVITRAAGMHCLIAAKDGSPIAAAALGIYDDTAVLAGASTIPAARRQGAQRALLDARLRFARERGADLAMVVAQPGSASQRNAERQGFRVAYTRTKWKRAASPSDRR